MLKKQKEEYGLHITINTTEDCNLRCKYCYEINKRAHSIPLEYCTKFIDTLLNDDDPCGFGEDRRDGVLSKDLYKQGVVFEFIGGDSLMDVGLLDKIMTYFMQKVMTTNTPNAQHWRNHFRFSISSNGTLFAKPEVRAFCEKWTKTMALSVAVSIDGCPAIHDKNRIMLERGKNGEELGSMKYILENWDWYRKTFPPTDTYNTKATCARDSIPYLYESLKYMYEVMGLTQINQNFIMEDTGCTDEDYKELDNQLRKCVEYVLEHKDELYWGMLDKGLFANHKLSVGDDWNYKGHCGSGAMPCLGINGNIYPCFRWLPHTQSKDNPEPIVVGNIRDGFNNKDGFRRVREGAYKCNCTREEKCKSCVYESSCSYCIGGCFAEHQDFVRTTYICEITKIQCKWSKVYWNEYNKAKGLPMEFNKEWQLDRVRPWTKPMSTTDELDY